MRKTKGGTRGLARLSMALFSTELRPILLRTTTRFFSELRHIILRTTTDSFADFNRCFLRFKTPQICQLWIVKTLSWKQGITIIFRFGQTWPIFDHITKWKSWVYFKITGVQEQFGQMKQARKPRSYASPKLWLTYLLTYLLTGVKCRATSVAKKCQIMSPHHSNQMFQRSQVSVW